MASTQPAGGLVFLDLEENTVNFIHTDGSNLTVLCKDQCCDNPDGVALDLHKYSTSKDLKDIVVYWTNMGRAHKTPTEKDGGDWHAHDGHLSFGKLFAGESADVKRVPLRLPAHLLHADGSSAPVKTNLMELVTTLKQLAITNDRRHLFFCDREGHRVWKYNIRSTELVPLLHAHDIVKDEFTNKDRSAILPNSDADKCRSFVGIALDEAHNLIFLTIKGPSKGGKGVILSVPYLFATNNVPAGVATPATEGMLDAEKVTTLRNNLPEPIDLLLDHEKNMLYWTDRGDISKGGNSLNRATLSYNANGVPTLGKTEMLLNGFDETIALTWAVTAARHSGVKCAASDDDLRRFMYVTDINGNLWKCDLVDRTKTVIYKGNRLTGIEYLCL